MAARNKIGLYFNQCGAKFRVFSKPSQVELKISILKIEEGTEVSQVWFYKEIYYGRVEFLTATTS